MDKQEIRSSIKNLKDLTLRNLRFKYASTFLGLLWAGLIPLILMAAITFAFMKVMQVGGSNFHIFVLSGIVPWLYFSNLIMESTQAFVKEKTLLHQFSYSKIFYPLSVLLANFIQHLIALGVLLPIFILYNHCLLYKFLLLLGPILSFSLFLTAVSIITAIFNLYIRDLEHFLGVGLMILFWLSPVFYSTSMVPPNYKYIIYLNPLSYFIDFYRVLLLKDYKPLFSWNALSSFALALIFLTLACFLFKKLEGQILKKI